MAAAPLDVPLDRYEAREAATVAMADVLLDRERNADEDEQQREQGGVWSTVRNDTRRCVVMCGFRPEHFLELFAHVEPVLPTSYGRGRRSRMGMHDQLLMLLVYLKHYETWSRLGQTFGVSATHVRRTVTGTATVALPVLWQVYVEDLDPDATPIYNEFPRVTLLMDVTFQPCWTPNGQFNEKKRHFSGKHKMYGLKSQCVHDRNGAVVHCVPGVPGAVHDLTIAQRTAGALRQLLRIPDAPGDVGGGGSDVDVEGEGAMAAAAPQPNQLLVDSGYQGLQHVLPCVMPHKRRRGGGPLTNAQRQHNRRVGRRRVLAENYYGRLKQRYRIMCDKYRGEREEYALYFKLCIALTNYHVKQAPLRQA